MKISVIITGATGMVGEGVLHECLLHDDVERVLAINRKPCGVIHPKLKEIIHSDFFNFSSIEPELKNYSACFFCLGVSSIGMKEKEFHHLTYDLTMHVAQTVSRINHDMVFCYISGKGTDSTENGRMIWARVKGKTENHLQQLPFKKVYLFRPGYIQPTKGLKNTLKGYRYVIWMYPFLKSVLPSSACSLREIGLAMIHAATRGYDKSIIEVKDIVLLAKE